MFERLLDKRRPRSLVEAEAYDAGWHAASSDARAVYEPCLHAYKCDIIDLRHEVARLKVYEEFVLGRGKQYGALSHARLRK